MAVVVKARLTTGVNLISNLVTQHLHQPRLILLIPFTQKVIETYKKEARSSIYISNTNDFLIIANVLS